ncbi:ThuA domain-containing protein [Horticoccus sp. 23ND18S-11]|uniref:ThuA domain-containing protein n=1 Tax=Horticoccus sp. 23ND18S-11 TaxID=3391832 RepID=UPI0039C94382
MKNSLRSLVTALLAVTLTAAGFSAAAPKPLKVLLVTGGCCHDYVAQKDILKKGLEQRANVIVEHMHTPDKSTKPPLACLTDPNYAKGYDLVIHDECAAGINDVAMVKNVLQPHLDGIPAVALHCAMHSYRVVTDFARPQTPGSEGAMWFDFLGLQSTRHGPQEPIAVTFIAGASPITRGMTTWQTGKEELYNNIQPPSVFAGHRALATGRQTVTNKKDGSKQDADAVVVWTNEFGPKKTRVFSTSLGHNNSTVEDARYLDLVARGLLWAAGKLGQDGKPVAGYEAQAR